MKANTYCSSKTNQSQTKTSVPSKPIYMYRDGSTTISLIPRLYGKIAVEISTPGKKYNNKLQAAIDCKVFLGDDAENADVGSVHGVGYDIITPERAQQKFNSEVGFIRTISAVKLIDSSQKIQIDCVHCERGHNGKLIQCKDNYSKEVEATLPPDEYDNFLQAIYYYHESQKSVPQERYNASQQYTRYDPDEAVHAQPYDDAANNYRKPSQQQYQQPRYTPQSPRRANYAQGGDWQ